MDTCSWSDSKPPRLFKTRSLPDLVFSTIAFAVATRFTLFEFLQEGPANPQGYGANHLCMLLPPGRRRWSDTSRTSNENEEWCEETPTEVRTQGTIWGQEAPPGHESWCPDLWCLSTRRLTAHFPISTSNRKNRKAVVLILFFSRFKVTLPKEKQETDETINLEPRPVLPAAHRCSGSNICTHRDGR